MNSKYRNQTTEYLVELIEASIQFGKYKAILDSTIDLDIVKLITSKLISSDHQISELKAHILRIADRADDIEDMNEPVGKSE